MHHFDNSVVIYYRSRIIPSDSVHITSSKPYSTPRGVLFSFYGILFALAYERLDQNDKIIQLIDYGGIMKRNIFLIIALVFSFMIHAQDWVNYNTNNTLFPSNPYKVIKLDQQGNKWVGTQFKGIFKYDGTNWEIFNTANSALPSDQIKNLNFDDNNNLWVCMATGGLGKLNTNDTWTFYNKTNSLLPANDVNGIVFDNYNNAWIATKNGLALLDSTGNWIIFNNLNSSMISNEILSVALENINGQTVKWIGTANGLLRYDDTTWQLFTTSNSALTGNAITNVHIDKKRNKWLSVYNSNNNNGGGLIKVDTSNVWTVYTTQNSNIPSNNIFTISTDSTDTNLPVWIGTDNGLAKLSGSAWTIYNTDNTQGGLLSNQVYSLALQGNIKWIGTEKLMLKYSGTTWTSLSFLNSGLADNRVNAIISDKINGLTTRWIATSAGLSKFDGTNWTVYNMANSSLPSNIITSLCTDQQNQLWIGTKAYQNVGGGLAVYNYLTNEWIIYTTINSNLPSNNISSIICDKQNNTWIGTQGAGILCITSTNDWIIYNENNSEICSNNIQAMKIDSDNHIWIATDYGVSVFNKTTNFWTTYNTFNSELPSNNISKISFSGDYENVWIATDNGLIKKTGSNWKIFNTINSSIVSNVINDVQADSSDFIWIATNNGLMKTDEANWQIYNLANSQIASNQINGIYLEYSTENDALKWLSTNNNGLSIFKKGNQTLDKGLYLSIFQQPYIPGLISINGFTNRISADTVYMSINNINAETEHISSQQWRTYYSVNQNADLVLKFRAVNAFMDSTITRNVSINFITQTNNKVKSPDKRLNLESLNHTEDFVVLENLDNNIYQIEANPNNLYHLKYQHLGKQIRTYILQNNVWKEINTLREDSCISFDLSNVKTLKFEESAPVLPSLKASNYPNPFNPVTMIRLNLKNIALGSKINVKIFNIKGQLVKELLDDSVRGEIINLEWNAKDDKGLEQASGVYFYQVKCANEIITNKMLLVK